MREREQDARKHAKRLRGEMPRAEALLWTYLRRKGVLGARFRRQHPIGPYVADFACVSARLVVEVDGATHWTEEQVAHDRRRTEYMAQMGWRLVRVTNTEVYENMDGVWELIARHVPPPSRPHRLRDADATPPPQAGEE
jgi:very-short-patch-repair endonuclease